jgi:chorismate-pyruvate lyase
VKPLQQNDIAPRAALSDIYPLDEFYSALGSPVPEIRTIAASELPEPYQSLLAHHGDMTSKLESFHKGKIRIHLLAQRTSQNEYFREVILLAEGSEQPVEFGAIKIVLDLFPAEAQREILRERQPLGRILTAFGVPFRSEPRAYLHMEADDFIKDALRLDKTDFLYGRRNTLVDPWGRALAEIVEILPPTAPRKTGLADTRSNPSRSLPT